MTGKVDDFLSSLCSDSVGSLWQGKKGGERRTAGGPAPRLRDARDGTREFLVTSLGKVGTVHPQTCHRQELRPQCLGSKVLHSMRMIKTVSGIVMDIVPPRMSVILV